MSQITPFPAATILGYPRIGPRRELKHAVESFWAGRSDLAELTAAAARLRADLRDRLTGLGLGAHDASIPSDFSYYDQVLDVAVHVGAIPKRFADLRGDDGALDLPGYFTLARGEGERAPLEMTKWFDSNYHYLVPEIGPDTAFDLVDTSSVRLFTEAADDGVITRPVLVGPVTFLLLSKAADDAPDGFEPLSRIDDLTEVYSRWLAAFAEAGAPWVQLDEPALVCDTWPVSMDELSRVVSRTYTRLAGSAVGTDRPGLFVAAPYERLEEGFAPLVGAGVEAIGLDLVRGEVPATVTTEDTSQVTLVAGVVNGRNVWRTDLEAAEAKLHALRVAAGPGTPVSVATSASLFEVPHTVADEPQMSEQLRSWLAFADEKIGEVQALAAGPEEAAEAFERSRAIQADRAAAPGVRVPGVRQRVADLSEEDFSRSDYSTRWAAQRQRLDLPDLPTTTIGSFPQTDQVRRARAQFRQGRLSEAEYVEAMRSEIDRVISLQEDLGLDVLVHGEPERNDMVQYFAEHLDGFATTVNGWVQSYGSRCTRPSILWGDVSRPEPITVDWSTYAASRTDKPVKGMLTGPVTILAWSFVRDDQPLADTAYQIALALRDEVADLEAAGIGVIQVDEPALRELLPLRADKQQAYLDWSVRAFRLATSAVADTTQVHTHLCYSEFGEVIGAIDGLDADVTSVEAARSKMEIVPDIAASGFARGIGPGVYDIHSPRVPSVEEITRLLRTAVAEVDPKQLWVNPDCGLKTRGYEEVRASLQHLVGAAHQARAAVSSDRVD